MCLTIVDTRITMATITTLRKIKGEEAGQWGGGEKEEGGGKAGGRIVVLPMKLT